ncbi:coproporphyrinogen dehydrogenase HemZ [Caldicellulosiruptor morganii]|uniref:Coproporphyrinogen dehydrogenase HemZ n=1 Tax=Caldicellulosiruptor morganii TaxID=1387555 RepID=A0ABY7BQ00_9FIRM|nr:coproporphyrinogen dehydrogenase HemZ [Caldicellulosiruptor morganii]WAM34498.1 coproporphyrinogen dehydrogenase HemZ [Caldicellulosiruptor morganii]
MKITYYSNSQKFLYDFQHIIRAFYPGVEIKFGNGGDVHFEALFENSFVTIKAKKAGKEILVRSFMLTDDEHESKKIFGRNLYDVLKALTGKELPWGILTGIRPTKIAYPLVEAKLSAGEACEYLQREYYIAKKKGLLLFEVAQNEIDVLNKVDPLAACLYIGIPICPTKCLYCSFSCNELNRETESLLDLYTQALLTELERTYEIIEKNKNRIVAIYFGGGSPAILGAGNIKKIFESLLASLNKEDIREITFEAGRPDTIDQSLLELLSVYKRDFNMRLCINPQTSNDRTLQIIGRNHTFEDIKRAFELAKEYGFENINSDVILGLPNESEEDFQKTIYDVLNLNPASITVHTLSIKRASLLRFRWQEYRFMDEGTVNNLLDWTKSILSAERYIPYYMYRQKNMIGNFENVGYSKRGFEGLYNVMIMQERHNIYACGAKAVSKFVFENDRIERVFNPADIQLYISRILNV